MPLNNSINIKEESFDQIIEEKDQILSLIYDTVGDVIFALNVIENQDFVFSSVNKTFLNATGLKREQVIGQNVKNVIPEPSLSIVLGHYETAIKTKSTVSWEEITPYPTGLKIGEVRIAPVFDQNDNCKMIIGSVHDITESRMYAKKLEESMEKIAQKNYDLEQLGYITSHDLKEPLNTIQSFSMLLKEELHNKEEMENSLKFIDYINSATERMQVLLKGMLDYNIIGEKLEVKETNIQSIVNNVLDDLAGAIMKINAQVKVDELPTINVYETQIRTLFQNLISNAIKYRRQDVDVNIEIRCEQKGNQWYFEVNDNGIGIDEEYFDRVFHVFQRLHKKEEFEGAGIGLSICKKVTELHEGQIWVENNSPHGTKFCFTISNELK
ncbi:PAS domain S-box protein [Flammeovirga sp. MY04]|uniref:sensor histidine kinase n=1 Tax=Flammeovirga sp. MY04 TaxID=1191459 RepID=UPI0008063247|nr:ATP-binding protein [Flammeovirga sp. MY04]ANQ49481.1 PAS domain S-box protein [Flammeovirga sp. MY04]